MCILLKHVLWLELEKTRMNIDSLNDETKFVKVMKISAPVWSGVLIWATKFSIHTVNLYFFFRNLLSSPQHLAHKSPIELVLLLLTNIVHGRCHSFRLLDITYRRSTDCMEIVHEWRIAAGAGKNPAATAIKNSSIGSTHARYTECNRCCKLNSSTLIHPKEITLLFLPQMFW